MQKVLACVFRLVQILLLLLIKLSIELGVRVIHLWIISILRSCINASSVVTHLALSCNFIFNTSDI
jgi:hypothetical protein